MKQWGRKKKTKDDEMKQRERKGRKKERNKRERKSRESFLAIISEHRFNLTGALACVCALVRMQILSSVTVRSCGNRVVEGASWPRTGHDRGG